MQVGNSARSATVLVEAAPAIVRVASSSSFVSLPVVLTEWRFSWEADMV